MSGVFAIRAYAAGDLESIVAIFQRSVREIASRDYSSRQIAAWAPEAPDLAAWAERLRRGTVFLAERQDEILGFLAIDAEGYIDLLFVHPASQRQGVATALCEFAVGWAAARAIPRLSAAVSLTAKPFFAAMGFRVLRVQQPELRGVKFRNFLMVRNTEPDADAGRASLA